MKQGRAGFRGIGRKRHARQRNVVDHDTLATVLCRRKRFRDHDGDRFAGEAHLVMRQWKVRRDERRRAIGVDQ
jgi:hypothetical protein